MAYFASQWSRELECSDPVFNVRNHRYFRDYVVPAAENQSNQMKAFKKGNRSFPMKSFKEEQSHKDLLDRSVHANREITDDSHKL